LVIMVIVGVAMPFFNVPATVLLQEKVEADYLGRIFGIMGMLASAMMPMGMLVFGPLADIVRVEWLLLGTGVVLFIQGFFLPGNKVLLEAGKPGFNPE
ncbi:MAG: MFS transporter, partial [Peptococcaceae bacterium]|nr:MFS transporter [Peptococcaceae bacterium]